MLFSFDTAMVVAVLLVATRFGALFILSPLFALLKVPVTYRVLFVLALSALILLGLDEVHNVPSDMHGVMVGIAKEALVGMLMAFGLFAAFAVFQLGGRVLDYQVGFGVANLIDPVTNAQSPLLGTVLNVLGVMLFFVVDGHHMLVRGMVYSLEAVPIGQGFTELNMGAVVAQFGIMFSLGIAIVAPAVILLLLLDVALAISARTMPQVNIFIVGIPLKIFLGLLMLALSMNYMSPIMEKIFSSIFRYWEIILQ